MITLPDIYVPAQTRLPVDQMDIGLDLLRTVHAGLQDHTFIDNDTLLALSKTMFVALEALAPVRDVLNKANRETPLKTPNHESLVEVIKDFHAGNLAFAGWERRGTNEEEAIEATYGPALYKLENWQTPLSSIVEVREAVRLAFSPDDAILSDAVKGPLRAGLIYLEKVTGWNEPEGRAA
ncbi:hypothetical protein [Brucella sp. 22210]|uniref:hypothetical protein n=1 Tax=Brucella sp. 22210 TaxID=3453892 RepID=UPI003F846473